MKTKFVFNSKNLIEFILALGAVFFIIVAGTTLAPTVALHSKSWLVILYCLGIVCASVRIMYTALDKIIVVEAEK